MTKPSFKRLLQVTPLVRSRTSCLVGLTSGSNLLDRERLAHDLKAALTRLNFALKKIENGYRFDDAHASEKIASLRTAIDLLAEPTEFYIELLDAVDEPKAP